MAIRTGYNGQVSRGLIFAFDSADFFNSYKGEPAVNTIPSPQVNSFPTFGNGWATYNTNKYCGNNGCAVHWDIPAISGVSNNIITTSGSHGIYSFDVITPQTTGGGVTAGVNYLARKISETQFSLHDYNGSQGGDQGYINPVTRGHKVHDSFWLDQRVSVSASGFPTRWWGPPHLPNSGLVKEIITGGFDLFPSQKTDCMRLHAHRPESADGMSYGPDAVVVPGQVHTYSFWTRALNERTANGGGSMSNYNYGSVSPTSWGHGYTHGPLGVWTKQSFQFTPINEYVISYFWPGALEKYDLANIQVERNTKDTPFVAGTRSNTQVLLDAAGGTQINMSNMSYDSIGAFRFDGTDDFIQIGPSSQFNITTSISVFAMVKIDNQSGWDGIFGTFSGGGFIHFQLYLGGLNCYLYGPDVSYERIDAALCYLTPGQWAEVGFTFGNNLLTVYINGVALPTTVTGNGNPISATSEISIGRVFSEDRYFGGNINIVKIYNRALTSPEVSQNFNSYKKRFNL